MFAIFLAHCRKRFMRQYATCLSKESMPFVKSKLPEAWGPWERQHAPPALQYGCIMLTKTRVVVSKLWITCRDWVFSLCGLEVGRPAFQLPVFEKCDSLPKKEICSTCLSKEFMPFVKSKPPLPTRSLRSLRAVARSTSSALWLHQLHHACKR